MEFSLQEHKAVVVGASRGIGQAIAIELASQGATVAIMARHSDQLLHTAELCHQAGGLALPLVLDVTDFVATRAAVEQAYSQLNGIDIIVLCQGIYHSGLLIDDKQDHWRELLNVNLLSSIHITRLALPYLIQEDQHERKRAIIYISSIAGKQSFAGGASYCASKHGLLGFSHAVFEEVREHGIKVSVICPGYVNTSMVRASNQLDRDKFIQPADIAYVVSEVIHSSETVCPVEITVRPQFSPYKK